MITRVISRVACGLTLLCLLSAVRAADPADTKPFTLRVLDQSTKQPIANVGVMFRVDNGRAIRTSTDADGKVVLNYPPTSKYVSINISEPAHVPLVMQFRAQESGEDHFDALMPNAVPINGRVQDEAGEAIVGATVVFQLENQRAAAWPHVRAAIAYERVTTDADGHWSFDQTPEDLATLSLGAYHPQYLVNATSNEGWYGFEKVGNTAALRDGSHVLTLKKGLKLTGQVVDADGKPVPGATVAVGRDRVASNVVPPVKVDADGKFELPGAVGQPITITANAKGLAPDLQTFTVTDPPKELTFKLGAPQTLSGRVVDASGKPLRGVGVAVDTWRGARTIQKRMTTNSDGRFTWTEAPTDEVIVDVFHQGHADQRDIKMVAGRDNLVTLSAPLTISGTVVDDATGQPVKAFSVIRGIKFKNDAVHWQRGQYAVAESTGTNGAFTRDFSYPYPGNAVRIEAPGYLPCDSPPYAITAGNVTFEFRMKRGQDITAVVTDAAGTPVADAEAILALPGNPTQLQNGRPLDYDRDAARARSDAAGKVSFPPQSGEFLVIVMADAGYAEISRDKLTTPDARIALAPWGKIEGQMFIGSKPAADAIVNVDFQRSMTGDWQNRPQVMGRAEGRTDAEGRFSLDRIAPNTEAHVGRRQAVQTNSYTTVSAQKVTVKPGETVTVRIGGVGRPVVGSLKLADDLAGQHWGWYSAHLGTRGPDLTPKLPEGFDRMTPEERRKRFEAWRKSDEGKAALGQFFGGRTKPPEMKYFTVVLNNDGTFRAEDVEPGTYELSFNLQKPAADGRGPMGGELANARVVVTVPAGPQSDEPVVVPQVIANPREAVRMLQPTPTPATQPAT